MVQYYNIVLSVFWDYIKSLVEHSSGIDISNPSLAANEKICLLLMLLILDENWSFIEKKQQL